MLGMCFGNLHLGLMMLAFAMAGAYATAALAIVQESHKLLSRSYFLLSIFYILAAVVELMWT